MGTTCAPPAPAVEAAPTGFDPLVADDELVRLEFEAIVAAEWSAQPPRVVPVVLTGTSGADSATPVGRSDGAGIRDRSRCRGVDAWTRQRSPPPRA
jgi:hypothetical protein